MTIGRGQCYPLGATPMMLDGQQGVNFALFSQNAERVTLCLFDEAGTERRLPLLNRSEYVWHGFVADLPVGTRYGYRVDGQTDVARGRLFNAQKLLLDPYAKAISGQAHYADEAGLRWFHYADGRDNVAQALKSVVVADAYDWTGDVRPNIAPEERVIYEMNVRGQTRLHPDLPEDCRGTFAGLAHPLMIAHLQALGVTTVELLPITYHLDEAHLQARGLRNYWGYNTIGHFAVDPRFSASGDSVRALGEFKDMVKTLHSAGIEVIMDIVFNHTAEQERDHPMLCQKGIDNASYYWHDAQGNYHNWTGCGNTINASHPAVMRWIVDCLRYWAGECRVDGFRFDLATQLGRGPQFSDYSAVFNALYQDPLLRNCTLIAEPWDIGEHGYQLGNFPARFLEWNDRFRDDMRGLWLQDSGNLGALRQRFLGSGDYFNRRDRMPFASLNFITAHDGFCLRDLVSYNHKHNDANGEDNRDGHNHNLSYNHGVEGASEDKAINEARYHSQVALLATLLLAKGTPMLLAGDELGHTQQGNNNSYCQDNALTWLNWAQADARLAQVIGQLIDLRQEIFHTSEYDGWQEDHLVWYRADGRLMQAQDWAQGQATKAVQLRIGDKWTLLFNAKREAQTFTLGEGQWVSRFGVSDTQQVQTPNLGVYVYENVGATR